MRYFKFKLIVLFFLLLLDLIFLASVFGRMDYFFTQLILISILILLSWQTFRLIDTTNRLLSKFLFALQYQDYAVSFPKKGKNSFRELQRGLHASMQQLASQKEAVDHKEQWMELLIEKLPIGLLYLESDNLKMINENACQLLSIPAIKRLEQLEDYHAGILQQMALAKTEMNQKLKLENGHEVLLYKIIMREEKEIALYFIQSFESIKGEVEMQAWLSLISVLTHEVMNSITTISSLAATLKIGIAEEGMPKDLQLAAKSIENRSKGLIRFTESYREVSSVPSAKKSWFLLSDLAKEQQQFLQRLNSVEIIATNEQRLFADREQMGQVLINLFLNAEAALEETQNPNIKIRIWQEKQTILLSFTDNGKGIPLKEQNQIFIPFYSTRKGGKGIGLSLCRQLMQNNEGRISLEKSEFGETVFQLRWELKA